MAQEQSRAVVDVEGFAGACQRLTVSGEDKTSECVGKIVATRNADGRTGYYFVLHDGSTVAFSAPPHDQSATAEGEIEVPIDQLFLGPIAQTVQTRASGSCDVTDLASAPVWIKCQAGEGAGQFSATFLSNNSGPIDLRGDPPDDAR